MGATVVPVEFGTQTLKEATSEAIRDWITNVETTHYVIGSCVGPAPYPEIVRELQAVIGREAREQLLEAEGSAAARRSSPASAVARTRSGCSQASSTTRTCGLIGVEAAGAASLGGGRTGRPARLALVDPRRRGRPDRRRPLDLGRARLPGRRPGARVPPRHRPGGVPAVHRRRGARRVPAASRDWRGSSPRSSRRMRWRSWTASTRSTSRVCLSGRGDKDLAEVLAALETRS